MAKTRVFKIYRAEGVVRACDQHGRYDFTLAADHPGAQLLGDEEEVFVNATPGPTRIDVHGPVRRRDW